MGFACSTCYLTHNRRSLELIRSPAEFLYIPYVVFDLDANAVYSCIIRDIAHLSTSTNFVELTVHRSLCSSDSLRNSVRVSLPVIHYT